MNREEWELKHLDIHEENKLDRLYKGEYNE